MKTAKFEEILRIVQKTNILPIISHCNIKCEFCSHKSNPESILTYGVPHLTRGQLEELVDYLSPERKIVIGESASRIVEGEPFLHKELMYILRLMREKYKVTPIQITSNGSYLTEAVVQELDKLRPIEINLSLNSSSPDNRKRLINDRNPQVAINGCKMLKKYGVGYSGSLVVMPHIVGWKDVEDTISYLCENGAETVRVFIPGYTKFQDMLDFDELFTKTEIVVQELRKKYDTPIVIEPPKIRSLEAVIEGVIECTPAHSAGFRPGDIIRNVSGQNVLCRVDAFNKVNKSKDPIIDFERNGKNYSIKMKKEAGIASGFVLLYDVNPVIINDIGREIRRFRAKNTLILTSELGLVPVSILIEKSRLENVKVVPVKNRFFGGSMKAAGLLMVEDIISCLKEEVKEYKPDLVLLPSIAFDEKGRDLIGSDYFKVEETFNIPTLAI